MQHRFWNVCNIFQVVRATILLVCAQHLVRSARNTIRGVCVISFYGAQADKLLLNNILGGHVTLFYACMQHKFRSACNTILGVHATPIKKCCNKFCQYFQVLIFLDFVREGSRVVEVSEEEKT